MVKKPSFLWALAVGFLFPVLQVVFFARAGTEASVTDYLGFVIAGTLIGLGFIYFLRRSETAGVSRAVIIGFVVGLPFAVFGLVFGGMVGMIGVIMLSVSPSVFLTGVGYFLGRAFTKK